MEMLTTRPARIRRACIEYAGGYKVQYPHRFELSDDQLTNIFPYKYIN